MLLYWGNLTLYFFLLLFYGKHLMIIVISQKNKMGNIWKYCQFSKLLGRKLSWLGGFFFLRLEKEVLANKASHLAFQNAFILFPFSSHWVRFWNSPWLLFKICCRSLVLAFPSVPLVLLVMMKLQLIHPKMLFKAGSRDWPMVTASYSKGENRDFEILQWWV